MQARSELEVLCVRQIENEPENDLNENLVLFSEATSEEKLPLSSGEFGFITLRILGVASTSSPITILPCFETSVAAIRNQET